MFVEPGDPVTVCCWLEPPLSGGFVDAFVGRYMKTYQTGTPNTIQPTKKTTVARHPRQRRDQAAQFVTRPKSLPENPVLIFGVGVACRVSPSLLPLRCHFTGRLRSFVAFFVPSRRDSETLVMLRKSLED